MKITVDKETTESFSKKDYYQKQLSGDFETGDNIELMINGEVVLDYTIQKEDCLFNLIIQDQGLEEKDNLDRKVLQKEILEREILEEQVLMEATK